MITLRDLEIYKAKKPAKYAEKFGDKSPEEVLQTLPQRHTHPDRIIEFTVKENVEMTFGKPK